MATEASFVLDGTVTALGKSTEPLLVAGKLTALVRVDAVVRAPPAMQNLVGREITVQLRQPAQVGDKARFWTQGLLYGASLAVEEVANRGAVPAASPRAALPAGERAATAREADQAARLRSALKARAGEAASIVVGQVVSVVGPSTAARNAPRLSEHDPHWSTATVTVGQVLKGRAAKNIKVLFANSQDVMWRQAPKLSVGQRAVLLLRKGAPGAPTKTANAVLDEIDVQSAERASLVATLL